MCGGAVLAELLASSPARRVTGAHIWPQGWVGTDGFEPAFGEFHSDSDSDYDSYSDSELEWVDSYSDSDLEWVASVLPDDEGMPARAFGALPGFSWPRRRSFSAFDMIRIPARPTMFSLEWLVPQFPERAIMLARDSGPGPHALRDAFLFADQFALDGADYKSLVSLFSADAVQTNAKATVGLWSFAEKFAFFDGGAYGSLDSLFGADAAQSNAKAAVGLWSFDND